MSGWPYWSRTLHERAVSFELDAEQASALSRDLHALLDEMTPERYSERVSLLAMKLGFDADYLRRREGAA